MLVFEALAAQEVRIVSSHVCFVLYTTSTSYSPHTILSSVHAALILRKRSYIQHLVKSFISTFWPRRIR